MKALLALLIVVGGGVAAFGIYTFRPQTPHHCGAFIPFQGYNVVCARGSSPKQHGCVFVETGANQEDAWKCPRQSG
jgi:hypothetical protein